MKNKSNQDEYYLIVSNILEHPEFQKLEIIKHHNTNRLDHSLKVSYYSYRVAKKLGLRYEEVARGALLHDFFIERTVNYTNYLDKIKLYTFEHPGFAVENAKKYFSISTREEDMIRGHMFPLDYHMPHYKESWVVNLVDTAVSTVEFSQKFRYQLNYATNLMFLFVVNMLK